MGEIWDFGRVPHGARGVFYDPPFTNARRRSIYERLAEALSFRDFGAIGNGVTDDTTAIANALASGVPAIRGVPGDIYRITANSIIYSNTILDLHGAEFLRDFEASGGFLVNETRQSTWSDENITILNFKARTNTGGRGGALSLEGVSDLVIDNFFFEMNEPFVTGGVGAGGIELSGENITLNRIYIDNYLGGTRADGVHLTYVRNFRMTNFFLRCGDDCIGGSFRPSTWLISGVKAPSIGVVIADGICETDMATHIRFGADSVASHGAVADAHADQVWKNVSVDNIVCVGAEDDAGSCIILDDARATVTTPNDDLRFSNIHWIDPGLGKLIHIRGNPDVTDGLNLGQRNWNRLEFDGIRAKYDQGAGQFVWGGGAETIIIRDCAGEQDLAVAGTTPFSQVYNVGRMSIQDTEMRLNTSGIGMDFRWVDDIEIGSPRFQGSGNEFAFVRLNQADALVQPVLRLSGGHMRNSQRGITHNGTNTISEVSVLGTHITVTLASSNRVVDMSGFTTTWDVRLFDDLLAHRSAYKATTETVTSSTTLQDDNELVLDLAAGKYEISFSINVVVASAAPGFRVGIGGTATATTVRVTGFLWDLAANAAVDIGRFNALGGAGSMTGALPSGSHYCTLEGAVDLSAAGTVVLRWAQNVSSVDATNVALGSTASARRIL